jgi:hypothetical protein
MSLDVAVIMEFVDDVEGNCIFCFFWGDFR